MIKQVISYFQRRKKLKEWKEEKMKKWLAEGANLKDIKSRLKGHKVKLFKGRKIIK